MDISEETQKDVQNSFDDIVLDDENEEVEVSTQDQQEIYEPVSDVEKYKEEQAEENKVTAESLSAPREYDIQLDPVNRKKFTVAWKIADNEKWIDYNPETSEIFININHPFFKPYSSDPEFKKVLESFVVSFICAEELAKISSIQDGGKENYILPSVFRKKMNTILKKICEKK